MRLVIAEKSSVGQSLAAVIGATARKDGYLEGTGWYVSWCVGHLAAFVSAEHYDPKYAKWHYEDLPILPESWQLEVDANKQKQFGILKRLMNAPDVTEVVNACDAGREGELIFRNVYTLAGCQKPIKRLWIFFSTTKQSPPPRCIPMTLSSFRSWSGWQKSIRSRL